MQEETGREARLTRQARRLSYGRGGSQSRAEAMLNLRHRRKILGDPTAAGSLGRVYIVYLRPSKLA